MSKPDLDPDAQRRICALIAGLNALHLAAEDRVRHALRDTGTRHLLDARGEAVARVASGTDMEYEGTVAKIAALPDLVEPVEVVPGSRSMVDALVAYLAGDLTEILRWLGIAQAAVGRPPVSRRTRVKELVQVRQLRADGLSREAAAAKVGRDQRALSTWTSKDPELAALVEIVGELDARLDRRMPRKRQAIAKKSRNK